MIVPESKIVKDYRISYIRNISTILIVFIHITQHLENRVSWLSIVSDWGNLGLVMFFCISGFLYSNRNIEKQDMKKWFANRYMELAIPSVVVVVITLISYKMFCGYLPITRTFSALVAGLGFGAFISDSWMFVQLWFLTYILVCYVSVPFIQKIDYSKMSNIKFGGLLFTTSVIFQGGGTLLGRLFGVPTLSWGILLRFYLPYMFFRRYDINSIQCKKIMTFLTSCSFILIGITCLVRYVWSLHGIMGALAELYFIYTQTMAGFVLFYWLYKLLGKFRCPRLYGIDKYSYAIYLTHMLFIGYSTSVIDDYNNAVVGIVIAVLYTGISSILLTHVCVPVKRMIKKYLMRRL